MNLKTLDDIKDECLSGVNLTEEEVEIITRNYKYARWNLHAMVIRGFSLNDDLSPHRETYEGNRDYRHFYHHFLNHFNEMRGAVKKSKL